jgi:biopolymer transport protein ExbD
MDMSVSIYPNPFEQQFKALLDNKYNNIQVIVQNTPGQIVYNKTFSDSKELVIDIPNLAAQTYLITIQADQKTFYAKLIKQ